MSEREGTPEDFARLLRGESIDEPEEAETPATDAEDFARALAADADPFEKQRRNRELIAKLHGITEPRKGNGPVSLEGERRGLSYPPPRA